LIIDAEITFKNINEKFFKIIKQMEPYGPGNLRPVFITRKIQNTEWTRIVKEQHIRFVLKNENITLTGIGFNLAEKFLLLKKNKPIDMVYTIDENEWNGQTNLQLKVIDFKLSEE
jgi:single-stranded-DNA-specific exonuclease